MPEVSIIIPIYNASKYLQQCLESVIAQNFQDIQIICINDGSTDVSLDILKEFGKRDARVIIIDQKNQGVSAARNAGLEIATGKYIGFVDSDDTITPEFFQTLYEILVENQCDVVFSRSVSSESMLQNNRKYSRQEIRSQILPLYFKEDGYNAIWNKLYAASVINTNKIVFPIGKTHGEDAEFNINYLLYAESLYNLNYSGYHYREEEGSVTRNVVKFNYLQNAVETFQKDWSHLTREVISVEKMHHLKKERFINNVISQIYIHAIPNNGLSIRNKLRKLHEIINNETAKTLFSENNELLTTNFSKYKSEVYKGIKTKSLIKLYLLSLYSYYRNK
ncbi:glycosyltransferase family 2 protein [Kaistella jeonii]|uniref:glycosyltransferase family 2 protein n=1 Tax=Kaistella jeonii TaxID=266749 RepID=UPI000689C5B9|nr:glycosyltransferase [Kaistella jeonii]SFC19889.1 Glycosyltransferase involved in cell wall bisynthesis [Kaistella jeonii]VEI97012.1 Chondroitin polymerase [Kaistella jeonii]